MTEGTDLTRRHEDTEALRVGSADQRESSDTASPLRGRSTVAHRVEAHSELAECASTRCATVERKAGKAGRWPLTDDRLRVSVAPCEVRWLRLLR